MNNIFRRTVGYPLVVAWFRQVFTGRCVGFVPQPPPSRSHKASTAASYRCYPWPESNSGSDFETNPK